MAAPNPWGWAACGSCRRCVQGEGSSVAYSEGSKVSNQAVEPWRSLNMWPNAARRWHVRRFFYDREWIHFQGKTATLPRKTKRPAAVSSPHFDRKLCVTRPLDFHIANKGRDRFCLSDRSRYYLIHTKEDISRWFYLILSPESWQGRCLKIALCHQKAWLERLGHFLNLNATVFKAKKKKKGGILLRFPSVLSPAPSLLDSLNRLLVFPSAGCG